MISFASPTLRSNMPYLEHFPEPGGSLQRVCLTHVPFRLGRDAAADLVIYCPRVSKAHAEIDLADNTLWIRDLGSTNGTFVNGTRIQERVALLEGDIIHLAEKEFRFGCEPADHLDSEVPNLTESVQYSHLRSTIQDTKHLNELIERQQAVALFQPIVDLADRQDVGYEALGRGCHPFLPTSPLPLFALAEKVKLAAQLSRVFRAVALAEAARLPRPHLLFLNVHPIELPQVTLLESLAELPGERPSDQTLVLEIHEDSTADTRAMRWLQTHLRSLDLWLAYDDFGVGQARLAALTQVPADFVKLDRTIVQGLAHSSAMRDLVRALTKICAGLGTIVIAEGLETEEDAAICQELGCPLGQGYLFGHPRPVAELQVLSGQGQVCPSSTP
jgi:EAL domain-containing protein (putative c-di-GMP-specific phosphodiesterase class I)